LQFAHQYFTLQIIITSICTCVTKQHGSNKLMLHSSNIKVLQASFLPNRKASLSVLTVVNIFPQLHEQYHDAMYSNKSLLTCQMNVQTSVISSTMNMEIACLSGMPLHSYHTTQHHIPRDINPHSNHYANPIHPKYLIKCSVIWFTKSVTYVLVRYDILSKYSIYTHDMSTLLGKHSTVICDMKFLGNGALNTSLKYIWTCSLSKCLFTRTFRRCLLQVPEMYFSDVL
jgi:hypothetical protein